MHEGEKVQAFEQSQTGMNDQTTETSTRAMKTYSHNDSTNFF